MKNTVISFRLDDRTHERLAELAQVDGKSISELLNLAVANLLKDDLSLVGYEQGKKDARGAWMTALREEINEAFDRADKKARARVGRK